ncbi:MAG: AMP-binding protein [Oscillospiraceae bacterium]
MQHTPEMNEQILAVAARIHEMREIQGLSAEDMAKNTGVSLQEYLDLEAGKADFHFTFIYKCAQVFGVEITDLMSGSSATLSSYTVTRKGEGNLTVMEDGIEIRNLAPYFRHKLAEPHWVRYSAEPEEKLQLSTHSGQEFDYIISGRLKVQVGDNVEVLDAGDSIYYNSSTPHGMVAVGDGDCVFCAVVIKGAEEGEPEMGETIKPVELPENLIYENFIVPEENEDGSLRSVTFKNEDEFNFAYDVVDALARRKPNKLAMLHVDNDHNETYFTFKDISRYSSKAANYFRSLGIKKGDKVMLVLRRQSEFWFSILALHKIGAVAIPATDQLMDHDFEYRFEAAGVSAIVCTAHGQAAMHAENAAKKCPGLKIKILAGGKRDGWHDFDGEFRFFSDEYIRPSFEECPCGDDTMLMFFTSGTTGYPKIAAHNYKYPLGHFVTAKYWHCVNPDGIHFTISDTGWGKALWGKLYGQWLCEAATFTFDFDRFDAHEILPMFKKYNITTFCAPPTMYRFMIKEDLSKYDLSSIEHATTAGEALNPEVFHQFRKATGLSVMEGFGQTETTLVLGNFVGMTPKIGAMGKPSPIYDVDIVDADGNSVPDGETGEIAIHTETSTPCGLFKGYYNDDEKTRGAWHDGLYHTGDTAWRDEDGYFWYVGRVDDVIKSSGYRIGPFEIESVIMELPYVLECGVSAAPDEVRGQVVKASIVLTKGTDGTEALKKEIQKYVKEKTAPYKYPRIVVFRDELPKTISGKIMRNKL